MDAWHGSRRFNCTKSKPVIELGYRGNRILAVHIPLNPQTWNNAPVSDSIKITVGVPARVLSPNTRCHWAMKAKATKSARIESWAATQIAMDGMKGNWIAAECQVYWFARDSRVRDRDNCLASLKATFDGLKDGGLLKDDSGLIHLPLRLFVDSKNPRVELFIQKIEITEASK